MTPEQEMRLAAAKFQNARDKYLKDQSRQNYLDYKNWEKKLVSSTNRMLASEGLSEKLY